MSTPIKLVDEAKSRSSPSAWHWVVLLLISICFFDVTGLMGLNGSDSVLGVRVVTALKLIGICSLGTLYRMSRARRLQAICRSFPFCASLMLLAVTIPSSIALDAVPSPIEFIGQMAGLSALIVILLDCIQCLRHLEFFMRGLFLMACAVAFIALLPGFTGGSSLSTRYIMNEFGGNRLTFGLLNANEYAYRLVFMALFGLYLWRTAQSLAAKLLYAGGIVLFMISIPLTYSRGAMITLLLMLTLGAGVLLFFARSWSWLLLLGIGVMTAVPYTIATTRLATLAHLDADSSAMFREAANMQALDAFFAQPFLGVGGNRVNLRLPEGLGVHNGYLLMLADLGIAGCLPFLLLLGGALCRLWKCLTRHNQERIGLASAFLAIGTVGWAISMFSTVPSYATWICIGLAWGCASLSDNRSRQYRRCLVIGAESFCGAPRQRDIGLNTPVPRFANQVRWPSRVTIHEPSS